MRRLCWILLANVSMGVACEESGIESLPRHLRPQEKSVIDFYRVGELRCPYWVSEFKAQDGLKGGAKCVNRPTLKEICAVAECRAQAGEAPMAAKEESQQMPVQAAP